MHRSKLRLEEIISGPVTAIAFPHGAYNADTLIGVNEAGFGCACTVKARPVTKRDDCLQLPRFKVEDWHGEQFENYMTGFGSEERS
jgi:hypothetical protein